MIETMRDDTLQTRLDGYLTSTAVLAPFPAAITATFTVEGWVATQEDVHHHSQAPQVAALVVRVGLSDKGLNHFRSHELSTAYRSQELGSRQGGAERAVELDARSQVEVANLHRSQLVAMHTQDVFWLQIAVGDS